MGMTVYVLFEVATTVVKLSILATTLRLLGTADKTKTKAIIYLSGAFIILQGAAFALVTIFQCRPVSDYWTLSFNHQNCVNETAHFLTGGILNTVTDFLVVILPIQTVMGLNIPSKQLYIVISLFCAAFMACIAGAVRTYYTYRFTTFYDRTWEAYPVWISSSVELYTGIICASVPVTKRFFSTRADGSSRIAEANTQSLSASPHRPSWPSLHIKQSFRDLKSGLYRDGYVGDNPSLAYRLGALKSPWYGERQQLGEKLSRWTNILLPARNAISRGTCVPRENNSRQQLRPQEETLAPREAVAVDLPDYPRASLPSGFYYGHTVSEQKSAKYPRTSG